MLDLQKDIDQLDHILILRSWNQFHEVEWEEKFTAKTLLAAQSKAGKWLKKQHFDCIVGRTCPITDHVHYRDLMVRK